LYSFLHFQTNPFDFYNLCKSLRTLKEAFTGPSPLFSEKPATSLLQEITTEIPQLLDDVGDVLGELNEKAAK